MTDYVADCVTDFCIFMSFKSVGKSFGGTYALRPVHTETIMKGFS